MTRLRSPPAPLPPPKPTDPPRPPPQGPHTPNLYKAPTVHLSRWGFPVFIPPVLKPSVKTQKQVTRKLRQFGRYADTLNLWESYQYYATLEEDFLKDIASRLKLPSSTQLEAGRREVRGMIGLLHRAMANMTWAEGVRVEKALKDWVISHPGATFRPYGKTMTGARRRELRAWGAEVRRVRREHKEKQEETKFTRKWEKKWGPDPLIPFKHPRQRSLKYAARKRRKAIMGHPEKVLKNALRGV
jgi:hypothetical protein